MSINKTLKEFGSVAALLLLWPTPAYAYLDPGTTSMILQALIGALVGGAIAIKVYWNKVKDFLIGLRKADKKEED